MKRENFLMIVVVLLLLLNFGTLGYLFLVKPTVQMVGHHPPKPDKLIIERLQLTPEQITVFEELKHEHRSGINQLNHRSKELYEGYFALLKNKPIDMAAADSMEALLAGVQMQKDSVTFYHFIKLRALCTEAQKPLFDGLVDELGHIFTHEPPRPRR